MHVDGDIVVTIRICVSWRCLMQIGDDIVVIMCICESCRGLMHIRDDIVVIMCFGCEAICAQPQVRK